MKRIRGLIWSLVAAAAIVPVACGTDDGTDDNPVNTAGAAGEGTAASTAGGAAPGAGGNGGGGADGGKASSGFTCSSPTVDALTGLVSCREGYRHRPQAVACGTHAANGGAAADLPRADGRTECGQARSDSTAGGAGGRASSDGCEAFYLGYCDNELDGGGGAYPFVCRSGCVDDADCGGGVCLCTGGGTGVCVPASCHEDQDCGAGFLCATDDPCGQVTFVCQNERDECAGKTDCDEGVCYYDEPQQNHGHRFCGDPGCAFP